MTCTMFVNRGRWIVTSSMSNGRSHRLWSSEFFLCVGGSYIRGHIEPEPKLRLRNALKTVDTIGNCQRLGCTVGVSQHMHKITNLWKFELNRSSELRDNNERKKHPCHTKLCALWCLILRPRILNVRSRNQIRGKLLFSRKLRYFRESPFFTMFYTVNSSPLFVTK